MGSSRVLVVDDDRDVRDVVVLALSSAGHLVVPAADGPQAMRLLQQQEFDVVVLDRHMPNLSGLEVTTWLRASIGTSHSPAVLMLSAHKDSLAIAEAQRCGVDDFLGKPFSVAELRNRVNNLAKNQLGKQTSL